MQSTICKQLSSGARGWQLIDDSLTLNKHTRDIIVGRKMYSIEDNIVFQFQTLILTIVLEIRYDVIIRYYVFAWLSF